jgi:hypothetical protein
MTNEKFEMENGKSSFFPPPEYESLNLLSVGNVLYTPRIIG